MVRPGPKPKPTALRVVQGNPGHRPLPEGEPEIAASAELPEPPEHLNDMARHEWVRTGSVLHAAGLLTDLDLNALAIYCVAYARWREAEKQIEEFGMLQLAPGSGYPMQSPYLQIVNKAIEQMTKIQAEFGMGPSSRTRVQPAKVAKVSKLDKYISPRRRGRRDS